VEHKAFRFDWAAFEQELLPTLERALATDDIDELRDFIVRNRSHITDPYEGDALTDDWEHALESRDAHEYADYALTKYYDPVDEHGVENWVTLSDGLPAEAAQALLGITVGPEGNRFDPGKMGSYFKDHEMTRRALAVLSPHIRAELRDFVSLLDQCAESGSGVYIRF